MSRTSAPEANPTQALPGGIGRRQALLAAIGPALLTACGGGGDGGSVPTITAHPADARASAGASASFTVAVADPATVSYQWVWRGRDIPGATQAQLQLPAVSIDENGSHYAVRVSNGSGSTLSQTAVLTVDQVPMTRVAGQFDEGGAPVDGKGAEARFTAAGALAADNAGNVYVADGAMIRKLAADGTVTHFAGSVEVGTLDGYAKTARFSDVKSLALDRAGGVLAVADGTSIRTVRPNGDVATRVANLDPAPAHLAAGADGTLYYAAGFRLSPAGLQKATAIFVLRPGATEPQLLAGAVREEGSNDGVGTSARFSAIAGLAVDAAGNLYIADADLIRRIKPDGTVETAPAVASYGNVSLIAMGMAMNAQGSIFTAAEYAIRRWKTNGHTALVARPDLMHEHTSSQSTRGMAIDSAGRLVMSHRYWVGRCEPFAGG